MNTAAHNANRYRAGCRCADCYRAMRRDANQRRLEALNGNPRHVDGTGTRRRLQALSALGWSRVELADRLGVTNASINARLRKTGPVHRDTAAKVRALYDDLWDVTPPPATGKAQGARTRAIRQAREAGWVVPMLWDDETIDDPDVGPYVDEVSDARDRASGRGAGAVNADSLHDCAIAWGLTLPQTADRLGVSRGAIEHGLRRLDHPDLADTIRAAFERNTIAQGHDQPTRDGLGLHPHRRTA